MRKILVLIALILPVLVFAQNPSSFINGIRLSASPLQPTPRVPRLISWNDDNVTEDLFINAPLLDQSLWMYQNNLSWRNSNQTNAGARITQSNTAVRTYTFPNKNGTVAMLDDVGGGGDFLANGTVPMTGDLQMGGNNISGIHDLFPNNNQSNIGAPTTTWNNAYIHGVFVDDRSSVNRNFLISATANGDLQIARETGQNTNTYSSINTINGSGTPVSTDDFIDKGYADANYTTLSSGSGSGMTIQVTGSNGGTYGIGVTTYNWQRIGNVVFYNVSISGINGSATGVFRVISVGSTFPRPIATDSNPLGSVVTSGIAATILDINARVTIDGTTPGWTFLIQNQTNDGSNDGLLAASPITSGNIRITGVYFAQSGNF